MNLSNLHNIYFLGIGGIGMSALARYFKQMGINVSGYDKTSTILTGQLQAEGIDIHFEDNVNKIPDNIDLVIYTPAIPDNLNEFRYLVELSQKNQEFKIKKRSEILGMLSREKNTITIAGTHGKTTVSTLIAYLLKQSEIDCTAFLGGISKNFESNLVTSDKSDWLVVEADEFDKSFLQLHPSIEVITSVDADHLDIYGDLENLKNTFRKFAGQIQVGGTIISKKGIDLNFDDLPHCRIFEYALNTKADFYAQNIVLQKEQYKFDINTPDKIIKDIKLGIPGLINVENAVAAIAVAWLSGVTENEIKQSLPNFSGIKRRFDYQINTDKIVYIDDYAHHPEEIRGFVSSVKKMYPGKKILGIFQPHLYSRTRDFAKEFASSLELLDDIILLPIYPAREKPVERIDSGIIHNKIRKSKKTLSSKEDLIKNIEKKEFDILLTLGAGDIDKMVRSVKEYLLKL
ncbi:MAG: UDP-N-acetylmuramate--L-alanine ligase [Bacteroidales bacterium]|nr:UDP-N-acetylmuramate--L-alanine ligase [Bacteroidales bacterium]